MARREHKEPNHERWLVSYADFITLLFAFFTIMYATSQKDTEKLRQFEQSLKKYLMKLGTLGGSETTVNQAIQYNSPIASPIKSYSQGSQEDLKYQVETFLEEKMTEDELEKTIQDISEDTLGVRISLSGTKIFYPESAKIRREAVSTLKKLARLIKISNKKVFIEGHMSSFSKEGSLSAWDLSAQRALQLVKFFNKVYKIPGKRLRALAYGDTRPLFPDRLQNPRNQRVDLLIVTVDFPL